MLSNYIVSSLPVHREWRSKLNFGVYQNTYQSGFTHETEKDRTENVFLGMTKLGKTKLGIRFAENLFYEIPTFMAKTRISKYEKFKN